VILGANPPEAIEKKGLEILLNPEGEDTGLEEIQS